MFIIVADTIDNVQFFLTEEEDWIAWKADAWQFSSVPQAEWALEDAPFPGQAVIRIVEVPS